MATSAVWGFWTCVGVRQGQTTDTVGRISKYNYFTITQTPEGKSRRSRHRSALAECFQYRLERSPCVYPAAACHGQHINLSITQLFTLLKSCLQTASTTRPPTLLFPSPTLPSPSV